jgi:hypothetical protein
MLWWLQRCNTPRLNTANYPRILRFLDDLYTMLPLPRTHLERWLVKRIANWIDQEKADIYTLASIGVVATGRVPKQ